MDDDKMPVKRRPMKLSRWQRSGAVASGAAMLGTGGWAEIASGHDGPGTVAFVAAGTLMTALGIVGQMPRSISGKDYTAEFGELVEERAKESIVEAVEAMPREVKEKIAEQDVRDAFDVAKLGRQFVRNYLNHSPEAVMVSAAREGLELEDRVVEWLREAIDRDTAENPDDSIEVLTNFRPDPDVKLRVDLRLLLRGMEAGIIIKAGHIGELGADEMYPWVHGPMRANRQILVYYFITPSGIHRLRLNSRPERMGVPVSAAQVGRIVQDFRKTVYTRN